MHFLYRRRFTAAETAPLLANNKSPKTMNTGENFSAFSSFPESFSGRIPQSIPKSRNPGSGRRFTVAVPINRAPAVRNILKFVRGKRIAIKRAPAAAKASHSVRDIFAFFFLSEVSALRGAAPKMRAISPKRANKEKKRSSEKTVRFSETVFVSPSKAYGKAARRQE